MVYNLLDPGAPVHLESTRAAAQKLGVHVVQLPVQRPDDFERVLSAAIGSMDVLLTYTDPLTDWHWDKVAEFAGKHRVPTVCEFRRLLERGCLMSYGPTLDELNTVAARQVDKILKGARLAIFRSSRCVALRLLLNAKTAKMLGITIPRSVLIRADERVERP